MALPKSTVINDSDRAEQLISERLGFSQKGKSEPANEPLTNVIPKKISSSTKSRAK